MSGENWVPSAEDPRDRRLAGGYLWRENVENAQQICLDLLVGEDSLEKRRQLRRLYDLLADLYHAREKGSHE